MEGVDIDYDNYDPSVRAALSTREFKMIDDCHVTKVVFLGTSSAVPSPLKRNTSSLAFVLSSGRIILCDCGEATQHQIMLSKSVKLSKIDMIMITHLHLDHCAGLVPLLCTLGTTDREDPLTIVGPKGIQQLVETTLYLQGGWYSYDLHFIELDATKQEQYNLGMLTDGITVDAYKLQHRVPTFGYKITEPLRKGKLDGKKARQLGASGKQLGDLKNGKDVELKDGRIIKSEDCLGKSRQGRRFVLLQDTSDSSSCEKDILNCDMLIHEATYDCSLEDKCIIRGHSTARMAGKFAKTVNAKLLVLTHFSSRYTDNDESSLGVDDLQKEAYKECKPIEVVCADDFLVLESHKSGAFQVQKESDRTVSFVLT